MQRTISIHRIPYRGRGTNLGQLGLLLFVIAAYFVVFFGQLQSGLEFDEAINLTVVKNLAEGNGYSTNLKAPAGSEFHNFDPFVSTGPTLLGPSAVVWNLSDGNLALTRLVPLAFFAIYLVGAFLIVRRIWGFNAATVGIAVPLLLNVGGPDLVSNGLSVGRFIGEFVVVAMTYLGILLLLKQRYYVASLVLGLAALTKLNWLLISIAILGVWFLLSFIRERRFQWFTWLTSFFLTLVPLIAFELYKFVSLGASGYRASANEYSVWLTGQGSGLVSQVLRDSSISWGDKFIRIVTAESTENRILDLFGLLSVSGLVLLVLSLLTLVGIALLGSGQKELAPGSSLLAQQVTTAVLFSAVLVVGWWVLGMAQTSARIGLPFWLLVGPLIGAGVYRAVTGLQSSGSSGRELVTGVRVGAMAVFVIAITVQTWTVLTDNSGKEMLKQQELGALVLVESRASAIPTDTFWVSPEMQVLTDLPTTDQLGENPGDVQIFTSVRALLELGSEDARDFRDSCNDILYESQALLICK